MQTKTIQVKGLQKSNKQLQVLKGDVSDPSIVKEHSGFFDKGKRQARREFIV